MTARDYMTVKVWDIRVESHAVETYSVHDYLRGKLCTLYENDSIFDKFECIWSNNDRYTSITIAIVVVVCWRGQCWIIFLLYGSLCWCMSAMSVLVVYFWC